MPEPNGWDDPREKQDTGDTRRRSLLGAPDDVPSPRILKLALVAAAIIVVIAIILYFKARKAPPALHNDLRIAPLSRDAATVREEIAELVRPRLQ